MPPLPRLSLFILPLIPALIVVRASFGFFFSPLEWGEEVACEGFLTFGSTEQCGGTDAVASKPVKEAASATCDTS